MLSWNAKIGLRTLFIAKSSIYDYMSSYWNFRLVCDGIVAVVIGIVISVLGLWILGVVFIGLGILCLWLVWRRRGISAKKGKEAGLKKEADGQYYPTQDNNNPP